jgi:hypothetical protein
MTLDSFFEQIDNVLSQDNFKECNYPVYRGHSKHTYELLPTLQRDFAKTSKEIWTLENNLYCDFRSLVGPKHSFDNSWQSLFTMRHEGIPTRLLDWTENIGTAIYFALDSTVIDKPHIWILNPFKLNLKSHKDSGLLNPEEDMDDYSATYAQKCFDDNIKISELPIAVYPNRSNDRIFAQRGLFTIHGTDSRRMEDLCMDCIAKIDIPDNLIDKLKKVLKQFGINKYSIYPDLKGLSDYLKEYYKY